MPIHSRLARLERSRAERAVTPSPDQAAEERFRRLVMSDPEAHDRAVRLAELLASSACASETAAASSGLAERLNCLAA
jgi:hypothetical protein